MYFICTCAFNYKIYGEDVCVCVCVCVCVLEKFLNMRRLYVRFFT